MKKILSWLKEILYRFKDNFWTLVFICGIVALVSYYQNDKNKKNEPVPPFQPSEEELILRQYDLDLCPNKDDYEKYVKEKYNVLDDGVQSVVDFSKKERNYDPSDNNTYYLLDAYGMIHNNELDTCIAYYKLQYALPEPNMLMSGRRETRFSRYIVNSKNNEVLRERTATGQEYYDEISQNTYGEQFRNEIDKYRDNLPERQALREKELKESEALSIEITDDFDFINIDDITKSLFNKPYNAYFSDEEKLAIQDKINEDLGLKYTRYLVKDWPYSGGGIEIVDAIKNNIQTIDISELYGLDFFTSEDYTYNNGGLEKNLTYIEYLEYPESSFCFEGHDTEKVIDCPNEMYPISGTKMCFDLKNKEQIDCRLIKF